MLQETTGYFAAHNQDVIDGTWNANDLYDRLINAGLAGTTLGAGFSTAGAAVNTGGLGTYCCSFKRCRVR